jgi:hypothetical protein
MNKRYNRIVSRESQRYHARRQRAPRKDRSRIMEETSGEEIGDPEDMENDRFTRTLALVYFAVRVWELKHRLRD